MGQQDQTYDHRNAPQQDTGGQHYNQGTPIKTEGDSGQAANMAANRHVKSKSVYENFYKTIVEFNRKRNTPIREPPQIDGRLVNLYILYGYVLKVRRTLILAVNLNLCL